VQAYPDTYTTTSQRRNRGVKTLQPRRTGQQCDVHPPEGEPLLNVEDEQPNSPDGDKAATEIPQKCGQSQEILEPPYQREAIIVWVLFDLGVLLTLWWRAQRAAEGITAYGFQDPERAALGLGTICITALLCYVIAVVGKYLIGDWVKNVQYTAAAIEKGVEKDEEFLHLCVMSYLTVIVFSICGPIQFGLSLMVMFSGDNSIRVNPPSLQADGKWTVVVEMITCIAEIFVGYILYETVVWFRGWENFAALSLVHHGGFLLMGLVMRGVEALPLIGASAVAMELSSPVLVVHMITRQLYGWERLSESSFVAFAPQFIVCRLVCYTAALGLMFNIYFAEFELVAPRLMEGHFFHILAWLSFAGGLLQWAWSPNLFSRLIRKCSPRKKRDDEAAARPPLSEMPMHGGEHKAA